MVAVVGMGHMEGIANAFRLALDLNAIAADFARLNSVRYPTTIAFLSFTVMAGARAHVAAANNPAVYGRAECRTGCRTVFR